MSPLLSYLSTAFGPAEIRRAGLSSFPECFLIASPAVTSAIGAGSITHGIRWGRDQLFLLNSSNSCAGKRYGSVEIEVDVEFLI